VNKLPQRLDAAWLTSGPIPRLLGILDRDGEEAGVVGGAVRNTLLGEPVHEFDVATTALPEEVTRRAQGAGFKAVPTGIEHGTITVVIDGHPFEVTTLRQDVETYGRHAKVEFGRDWRRDAERRDFTINALSVRRDGVIHDFVGGLADLAARRVRFIGDAATRIAEDYLRILRFFRFHAAYGEGPPDRDGLHACIVAREGLDALSRERVRMELIKLLVARHTVAALAVMAETGLLLRLIGGVPLLASLGNMINFEAAIGENPDPVRRLAALATLVPEDADRLTQRLRLSNDEHARLVSMATEWWRIGAAMSDKAQRALLYRIGPQHYRDRALLAWSRAREGASDTRWQGLATLPRRWTAPKFPLAAADFMRRGIEKGPKLGAALRAAEVAWIEADFPEGKAALSAIAEAALRNG
jgi:poly(A) polymerase